ncbi:hypothetical protein PYCC9005_004508 [Savitreella phatthalungensis]
MSQLTAPADGGLQLSIAKSAPEPASIASLDAAARDGTIEDWSTASGAWRQRLRELVQRWCGKDGDVLGQQLDEFKDAPPHTVQRLAELLADPGRWYDGAPDKFYRALERVLTVTSTTADFPVEPVGPSDAVVGGHQIAQDALLIPIPWLKHDSDATLPDTAPSTAQSADVIRANDGEDSGHGSAGAGGVRSGNSVNGNTTTTMPNGVKITYTSGPLDDIDDASSQSAATPAVGSAPIDAADVGAQPAAVQQMLAGSGSIKATDDTKAGGVQEE